MENTTLRQPNERARHLSICQIVTFETMLKIVYFNIQTKDFQKSHEW